MLAVPVANVTATVTLHDGAYTPLPLIDAALARVGVRSGYAWTTDIPRAVGLAGSSALVIAALRASGAAPDDPFELAQLALSIERDDLGIAAGLQDRATQAYAQPVLVDFEATPIVRVLVPAAPLDFVVVWDADAGGDSGEYHRGRQLGDDDVRAFRDVARAAADAFESGDAAALASCMATSARLRDQAAPLSPAHNALAERLRRRGLAPNSAGSGGAVIAVRPSAVEGVGA